MNKRILITGGAGFIGSHLNKKLSNLGWDVTVLDNLSSQIHGTNLGDAEIKQKLGENVKFIKGDVCNKLDMAKALNNQDAVVHLAAETGTGQSMYQIEKYVDINSRGTAILLDYLVNSKHKVQKIIVASSRSIYGEGKNQCPIHNVVFPKSRLDLDLSKGDFHAKCPICSTNVVPLATEEDSPFNPSSIYAITKLNQEQMVLCICSKLAIQSVALRFQNVFGPGQSLKNPYTGILSIFSTAILNGESINIFEDGLESRDFVYINDAIEAIVLSLESDSVSQNVLNVGTGEPVTVVQVAQALYKFYDKEIDIKITGNYRLGDIRHNFASLDAAKKIIGFQPLWSFQEGVKKFVDWVMEQKINTNVYQSSLEEMKKLGLMK